MCSTAKATVEYDFTGFIIDYDYYKALLLLTIFESQFMSSTDRITPVTLDPRLDLSFGFRPADIIHFQVSNNINYAYIYIT